MSFYAHLAGGEGMAEIDSLEIKISASAEQANKAIRHLTRSLGTLSSALKIDTSSLEKLGKINGNNFKKLGEGLQSFANAARSLQGVDSNNFNKLADGLSKIASIDSSKLEALGKIDGNSFRRLGEGVKALSAGLKDLKGVSTKKFETLASGIERLGAIQVGNMQAVASALTPLADGIRTLSNANFDNRNLQNLINSLTRLSSANVGNLANVDFSAIGNKIKDLATALSGADKVEQNTISITNAIAKLAGAGANIGTVTAELPRLGTALKDFINTMSSAPILASETIAFTQALGQLASAGSRAETVANSLQHLGDELKRFMQTMASVPNVGSNVIQMTQALAQLANTGGGTSRAATSIGNAFNGASISAIRLSSNTNILSVSLKGLGTRLNKTLKGVKLFTSQILAAAGIMGGLYGIIRGGLKAMEISSSLTEVQNVVDTTFGNMSDKVQEFADNSIRQFGMSELSVKQFASRFQAMGTAMGIPPSLIKSSNEFLNSQTNGYVGLSDSMSDVSLNLTKLTADIASFYDVEQAEVAEDLAAIYTGMTVPLRKYGLDLTQATLKEWAMKNGLDANVKSMSQAEKTMLRYQYVLANTTAAQGDFAKTADTWANQVRILKQSFEQLGSIIGTSLINAFKPLVQTLNSVLLYVIDFAEKVTEALGTIFGWKYESGGTGGIAQDWSDIADTTGEAADNIDKMKKGLRAFDELNNITSPDKDGTSGGVGGAGEGAGGGLVKTDAIWENYKSEIDTLYKLGKYIGDALSKAMESIDWDSVYQKARNFGRGLAEFLNGLISPRLFENIGKTIAGALNTALHFLDSFGLWFNWKNFGDSLAAGLLGFLNNIQWDVALSAATHWGRGIADTLNHFITPETFSTTGDAIAMALNTAIQFALSFGQTFDFKNLGESVAAGINDFFATFNFKDLAETINIWAKGILDAVIKALDETDWDLIGSQIGQFLADIDLWAIGGKVGKALWKAINAGIKTFASSFSKAPVKTTLITLVAIPKALKAIADSRLIKGIQSLVKYFGNFASTAKLVATALAGNVTSLSTLMTRFPRFGSVVNVATQAFAEFRSGLNSQGLFAGFNQGLTTLDNGITNLRNSLSGFQKGLITAVAAVAEFTVISDVFEGLTLGSENLIAGIGKIGVAAGIAAAAMYTALGPAGLVIAGITGVAAAIKGISDAFDEIHAENVGNAIKDALTVPGGISLEEIRSNFTEKMSSIADGFSNIATHSEELKTAQQNIKNAYSEISAIKGAMDDGTLSVEEGVERINLAFSSMSTEFGSAIGALEQNIIGSLGEGSILRQYLEAMGYDVDAFNSMVVGTVSNVQQEFEKLQAEYETLKNSTNPEDIARKEEIVQKMAEVSGVFDETTNAVSDFISEMGEMHLDLTKIIDTDSMEYNDQKVAEFLQSLVDMYNSTEGTVSERVEALQGDTEKLAAMAEQFGVAVDSMEFQKFISGFGEAIEAADGDMKTAIVTITNTIQEDLVGGINTVIENAQSNWENLSLAEKSLKWKNDEQRYVDEYVVQYQNNIVAPLSQQIESSLSQIGIDGAGWASDAMGEIFTGMWNNELDMRDSQAQLSEKFSDLAENAITTSKDKVIEEMGGLGLNAVEGAAKGVNENAELFANATGAMADAGIDKVKEINDSHSPSIVYNGLGKDVVDGFNLGISENSFTTITTIADYMNDVRNAFEETYSIFNDVGTNIMQGLYDGLANMESSLYSKANDIANNIANVVKSALDIHSPSRVMFQLGDYTMQGFQNGLENLYQPIISSLKEFSTDLQITPSFEVGQFQPAPPPEFDFDVRQRGAYQIAAEMQRKNSGAYSNSDGYDNYSEELSLLMSQNQLLREQNRLLQAILDKPTIDNGTITRSAINGINETTRRTGKTPILLY